MSKPGLRDDACRDGQRKNAHENGKHEHRKVAGTEGVRGVEIHQLWVEGAWLVAGLFAQFLVFLDGVMTCPAERTAWSLFQPQLDTVWVPICRGFCQHGTR